MDLRDAKLLLRGGGRENAAKLAGSSIEHLAEAVIASERDWPLEPGDNEVASLDDDNPVKERLQALKATSCRQPLLLDDARRARLPDEDVLWQCIADATSLLAVLAMHFKVELAGEKPAGTSEPLQPIPASARGKVGTPSLVRDQKERQADAVPVRSAAPTAVMQTSWRVAKVSSTIFWALMDKWGIADLEALALLGHAKGLTRKGTRPRFKLTNDEADMVIQLQDVDGALSSLRLDPRRWLGEAIAEAPFSGAMPIAHVVQNKLAGALDLRQHVFRKSLRLSLERNKDGSRV